MQIEHIIENIEQAKAEGSYPRAREIILAGLKEHTDDYRLYEELADIHLFEGRLEDADEVLQIARELHPNSGTGMYLEGYIATAKGDFDRAITILSEANSLMPNNAEILRNLWWAHTMKGDIHKWLWLLRRSHTLTPEEPLIVNDLAVALMAAGYETEAREVLATIWQESLIDPPLPSSNTL